MPSASWIKYAYLAYAAKPKGDRELYRRIKAQRISRIVEVGIGDLARTTRLIAVAQRFADEGKVAYTGLDWFDARHAELESMSLKQAHRSLQATGAQVRLVPGPPGASLASVANAHQNTGLIIISQTVSDADLSRAWYYVPRMLREQSLVLREHVDATGQSTFVKFSASELAERAAHSAPRRVA